LGAPGATIAFSFSDPPRDADNVRVRIVPTVTAVRGGTKSHVPTTFEGYVKDGQFIVMSVHRGRPISRFAANATFRVASEDHVGVVERAGPDPEYTASFEVGVEVDYLDAPAPPGFFGRDHSNRNRTLSLSHRVKARFPLAMVVPEGAATLDPVLNIIQSAASGWKAFDSQHRHVVGVPIQKSTAIRPATPAHATTFIEKMVEAANLATSGVVALSVGHGGHGAGQTSVTGFNLLPEDNRFATTGVPAQFWVDLTMLQDGALPGRVPRGRTSVVLNTLDRLCDALATTPIQRLILYTCDVGNDSTFVQLLADRLQVPVTAERDFIHPSSQDWIYEKDLKRKKKPKSLEHWLVKRLGTVRKPGARPTQFPVVPA